MILSTPQQRNSPLHNQRGSYLMISVIAIMVLFGFAGLGVEVGRWYAVQGEMSKSIDGAAFAGAKNVNNPNIPDLNAFVLEVAQANFEAGLLGTDTPVFTVTNDGNGKITVDGSAHALNTLIKGFNPAYDKTQVATSGSAKLRNAEIALVLDISGSMAGNALSNLKDGAEQFVDNFADHETTSKFALLTFASGVMKPFNLDHNYVGPIGTAINGLNAVGGTNAEDALAQAGALPWTDQTALPPNERGKQVVVFFSDGNPTAFRGQFKYNGTNYDGVAAVHTGNDVYSDLLKPNKQMEAFSVNRVNRTGDGKTEGSTACPKKDGSKLNVKWYIAEDPTYGFNSFAQTTGLAPEQCDISHPNPLFNYHAWVNKQMALDNAQALKDQGIEIYTIGLGDVDQAYLNQLSSGNGFSYYTTDPGELAGIFQQIANILKLVLVS
ncbi:MAG: VWA domain-containing protein [Nitrospirales bacterium]